MIEIYPVSINKYYITNKLICQLKVVLNHKKNTQSTLFHSTIVITSIIQLLLDFPLTYPIFLLIQQNL